MVHCTNLHRLPLCKESKFSFCSTAANRIPAASSHSIATSFAVAFDSFGKVVERDQVILPAATLGLLDRNVIQFVKQRKRLGQFKQSTKKGLLFYGPPGTGKTHTIHYLARALEGHTTLLISAEQVGMLSEYVTLARLLQPSIVVLEDVDLIARDRKSITVHARKSC